MQLRHRRQRRKVEDDHDILWSLTLANVDDKESLAMTTTTSLDALVNEKDNTTYPTTTTKGKLQPYGVPLVAKISCQSIYTENEDASSSSCNDVKDDDGPDEEDSKESLLVSSSSSSNMSLSTEELLENEEAHTDKYMAAREMTAQQERWNGWTMIPSPFYCLYFVLAAKWLETTATGDNTKETWYETDPITGCLPPSSWHTMPALPPLPVLALAFGIIVHAPFSFLYHYRYSHTLTRTERTTHWSRRMDQCMIHAASALISYATSGNLVFFLVNAVYNHTSTTTTTVIRRRPTRGRFKIPSITPLQKCVLED